MNNNYSVFPESSDRPYGESTLPEFQPYSEHSYLPDKGSHETTDLKRRNDVFGTAYQTDYAAFNYDAEDSFRFQKPTNKRAVRPYIGALPMNEARRIDPYSKQMLPEVSTMYSKVAFNDALEKGGPFYLRHWQIFDNAPFLPNSGDVTKDPRYAIQTKGFTTEYSYMGPEGTAIHGTRL